MAGNSCSEIAQETVLSGRLKGKPYRKVQKKAIEMIKRTDKRFIACCAPTGSGKSVIAMDSIERPLFYLCSSKHLQDQLQKDFPEAVVIKGRDNYRCVLGIFDTVAECFLTSCDARCEYRVQKQKALRADVAVMNFHYFLHLANFTKMNEKRNIVVDEADMIEDVLVDFVSFSININTLRAYGINMCPEKKTVKEEIVRFLQNLKTYLISQMNEMDYRLQRIMKMAKNGEKLTRLDRKFVRQYVFYQRLLNKIEFIQALDTENWIYYFDSRRIHFKPLWLTREMTDAYLFNHGNRFLFMSATLPSYRVFCGLFGLSLQETEYFQFESEFKPENRPVFFQPKWRLSHGNGIDERKMRKEVLKVLEKHKEKGLIHTVNYRIAEVLKGLHPRIITHGITDREKKFREFLRSRDGVFVSPSAIRGIDLPDDLCRWTVIMKAPFQDLSDPVTSARCYSSDFGSLWYKSRCATDIVQAAGRIVRHENDWGKAYVWDSLALELLLKHPSLFPLWFRDAVYIE